ncbi:MAG: dienelactone hydrolase family protein [SAR324 cluster bacterium]|nr:dienelactone hydrolase family protein [SAR324 cluster bacterium]
MSYKGAFHGFSNPAADERGRKFNIPLAYNESADRNSWNSMKDLFENNF